MLTYPDLIVQNTDTLLTGLLPEMAATGPITFLPSERTPRELWNRQMNRLTQLPEPIPSMFSGLSLNDEELEAQFGPRIREQLARFGYDDEAEHGEPIRKQERLLHLYRQLDPWAATMSRHGLEYMDVQGSLETPWNEALKTTVINVLIRLSWLPKNS